MSSGFRVFLCFHAIIVGGIQSLGSASSAVAAAPGASHIPRSFCPRAALAFGAF